MATAAALIAAKKAKEKEEAAKEAAKEAEAQQRRQLQRREMTPDNLRIVEQKLLEFQKQQEVEQSSLHSHAVTQFLSYRASLTICPLTSLLALG